MCISIYKDIRIIYDVCNVGHTVSLYTVRGLLRAPLGHPGAAERAGAHRVHRLAAPGRHGALGGPQGHHEQGADAPRGGIEVDRVNEHRRWLKGEI